MAYSLFAEAKNRQNFQNKGLEASKRNYLGFQMPKVKTLH